MGAISHIDHAILLWINGFARHSYIFDKSVVLLTDEAFLKGGVFFIFLWWLWFRNSEDAMRDRIDVIRIAAAICFTIVIARALQILLPGRPRPINDPSLGFVAPFTQPLHVLEHWSSFPSDHALVFYALATAIWARYRLLGAVAFLWITVFAMLPRLYVGLHYPSDIAAGAVIGIVVMVIADALPMPRFALRPIERLLSWERQHPASFYCAAVVVTYEFMSLFDDFRLIGRAIAKVAF